MAREMKPMSQDGTWGGRELLIDYSALPNGANFPSLHRPADQEGVTRVYRIIMGCASGSMDNIISAPNLFPIVIGPNPSDMAIAIGTLPDTIGPAIPMVTGNWAAEITELRSRSYQAGHSRYVYFKTGTQSYGSNYNGWQITWDFNAHSLCVAAGQSIALCDGTGGTYLPWSGDLSSVVPGTTMVAVVEYDGVLEYGPHPLRS